MSTQIDERVVAMKFDRKDFEKNVDATMKQLDELDKKLQLKDAGKGFEELEKAADKVSLSGLTKSAEAVEVKFSTMSIVAIAAIERIVDSAIDAGGRLVKSMSIDQVAAGFSKYESKINAVQATLNATRDQGKTLEDVNAVLEKLSWYTDETSYHFDSMSNALSQFIASGQQLEDAGELVMGIANACGLAGVDATKAEHAMTGFVKAIGQGYISNQVWQNQLKTSGITNLKEFRQILIDTAVEVGTLSSAGNGLYKTLKGNDVTVGDINTNLADMWLNTDVMSLAFKRFGKFSSDAFALCEEKGIEAADAIKLLTGTTYEFSEAGFKAAQEAKTFTDAIGAVKEAVSQRWAKTFELILGNEEEAIELWTGVTEELLAVFTTAIDKRNEILKEWRGTDKNSDGRSILFEGIANIWTNLISIANTLKEAIGEIFPPMTGAKLLELTKKFRDFTKSIQLSQEALYSLKVIAKVLLVPFQVIFQLIRVGAVLFLSFVKITFQLAEALLYLFAVGNPIQDLLRKIFGEERYNRLSNAMSTLKNSIIGLFTVVSQKVKEAFGDTKPLTIFLELLGKIANALAPIGDLILDGIVWAFEQLAKMDFSFVEKVFGTIAAAFKRVGTAAQEFFIPLFDKIKSMSLSDLFNSMANAVKNFINIFVGMGKKNELADGFDETSESGNSVIDVLKRLIGKIGDLMKEITPAKILIIGFGVALINLAYSITKTMDSISGLTGSVSSLAKAIKNRISPTTNTFKTVAESIAMIAASLGALALVDQGSLRSAAIILASMIGLFTALVAAFALMNKFILGGSSATRLKILADLIKSLSVGIIALAGSMVLLNKVDLEGLGTKILAMVGVMAALTTITVVASNHAPELSKGAVTIIAYAAAVLLIAKALTTMSNINTGSLFASLGVVANIVLVLGAIGLAMKNVSFSGAAGILLMCANLIILVKALQKLGSYDVGSIINGLGMYFSLFGALVSLGIMARIAGDEVVNLAKTFIAMGAAIALISIAVKKIGQLSGSEVIKGTASVAALMVLLTVFTQISKMDILQEGTADMAKSFLAMSAAILVLMLAVKYLGKIPMADLVQGEAAVMALMGMFALIEYVGKKAEKSMGSILAMTAAVTVLTGALMLLSIPDFDELMIATISLSAILVAFGMAMDGVSKIAGEKTLGKVAQMVVVIGVVMTALGMLASFDDWSKILSTAGSFSLVLVALGYSMSVINNARFDPSNVEKTIVTVGLLSGLVLAITYLLSWINGDGLLEKAGVLAAIATIVAALASVSALISNFPVKLDKVIAGIAGVVLILGSIVAIIFAITGLDKAMNDAGYSFTETVIEGYVTAIGLIAPIVAISAVIGALLSKYKVDAVAVTSGVLAFLEIAGAMTLVIGAIVGIMALIASNETIMGYVRDGMQLFVDIMGGFGSAIAAFVTNFIGGSISGVGSKIAEMLQEFEDIEPDTIQNFAIVAHALFEAFSALPLTGGIFEVFTGKINFDTIAEGMSKLASGIIDMSNVINESGDIDLDKIQIVCEAAKKVAEMTDALPKTGGWAQTIMGSKDLGLFSSNLESFGFAIRNYWVKIREMDESAFSKIEDSAKAGEFLAKLANTLPSSGGVLQEWFGEKNLSTFGNQLFQFGLGLVNYYGITQSLDKSAVEHIKMTAGAGEAIAKMNKTLPSTGGKVGEWFFGSQSLEDFAKGMRYFAYALIALSDSSIDLDQIQNAGTASQSLVDMYNSLEAIGGFSSILHGKKDFESFGTQLTSFAGKLKEYSDIVTDIPWTEVDSSIEALEQFLWLSNKLKNVDTTTMKNFGEAMKSMANAGIEDFIKAFANSENQFELAGKTIANRVADGMESKKDDFIKMGENVVRGITVGIGNNLPLVKEAGIKIGNTILDAAERTLDINSPSGKFIRVAKFCILGLEKGFIENQHIANTAASNVAENFLQEMKDTLGIHSPSYRVRQEVVKPVLEAFPEEFDENDEAEQAAKAKGEAIISAFKSAFEDSNEARELMELERELFELKLSPDLSEEEKEKAMAAYDAEQQKKILQTYVDDYKLAVQEYQTLVNNLGAESSDAKEAQKQMLQKEITLRKYAAELTEATNAEIQAQVDQQKAVQEANKQRIYDYMASESAENRMIEKLKAKALNGELIDALGEVVSLEKLEQEIESGSYRVTYRNIVNEIYEEFSNELKSMASTPTAIPNMVNADDMVRDLLGGLSIDEYAMQDVAADLADSFVEALAKEMEEKAKSKASETSAKGEDAASILTGAGSYTLPDFDVDNSSIEKAIKEAFDFGGDDEEDSIFMGSGIMKTISDTVDKFTGWVSGSGDWASSAIDTGKNWISGLINGLTNRKSEEELTDASYAVTDAVTGATANGLGVHSPSVIAEQDGEYFLQGLAIGFRKYSHVPVEAIEEVAQTVVDTLNGKLGTSGMSFASIGGVDSNLSPVITPSLDLSEVEAGIAEIDAMLSSIEARAIAVQMNPTIGVNQNGSKRTAGEGGSSITFNQYNTSPKPLNEVEIYRLTKNQLTALKERGNVK